MSDIKIVRKPVAANTPTTFNFDVSGIRFLVKNFTDGDIFVALKSGAMKEESVLIPANCAQILEARLVISGSVDTTKIVQVIADTSSQKGVEVQCLIW